MKDHEKRELVNEQTRVAREFAGTEQLRSRLSRVVLEALSPTEADATEAQFRAALTEKDELIQRLEDRITAIVNGNREREAYLRSYAR